MVLLTGVISEPFEKVASGTRGGRFPGWVWEAEDILAEGLLQQVGPYHQV